MQLIVTAVGAKPTEVIEELSRAIRDCRCSVVEARMTDLAGDVAAYFLAEGNWNHVARLETALDALANRLSLKMRSHRLETSAEEQPDMIPYSVDVYAPDQPDALNDVVSFFSMRGARVHDVAVSRYDAPFSGSPLFTAHLIVKVPSNLRVVSLRDEFLDFCDHANLDAIMEPIKR